MTAVLHTQLQPNLTLNNCNTPRSSDTESTKDNCIATGMPVGRLEERAFEQEDTHTVDTVAAHGVVNVAYQRMDKEMREQYHLSGTNGVAVVEDEEGSTTIDESIARGTGKKAQKRKERKVGGDSAVQEADDKDDRPNSRGSVAAEEWEDANADLRRGSVSTAEVAIQSNCV